MLDMQKLYSAKNLLVVAFVLLVVVDQSLASNVSHHEDIATKLVFALATMGWDEWPVG